MMTLRPIGVCLRFIYQALDCGLESGRSWHLSIRQSPKFCREAVKPASVCPAHTASCQRYCSPRSSRKYNYPGVSRQSGVPPQYKSAESERCFVTVEDLEVGYNHMVSTSMKAGKLFGGFLEKICEKKCGNTLDRQSNYWTASWRQFKLHLSAGVGSLRVFLMFFTNEQIPDEADLLLLISSGDRLCAWSDTVKIQWCRVTKANTNAVHVKGQFCCLRKKRQRRHSHFPSWLSHYLCFESHDQTLAWINNRLRPLSPPSL